MSVIIIVEVDGASGFRKLHSKIELIHAEGVIRERVEKEARLGLEVPEDNRAVADEHVSAVGSWCRSDILRVLFHAHPHTRFAEPCTDVEAGSGS